MSDFLKFILFVVVFLGLLYLASLLSVEIQNALVLFGPVVLSMFVLHYYRTSVKQKKQMRAMEIVRSEREKAELAQWEKDEALLREEIANSIEGLKRSKEYEYIILMARRAIDQDFTAEENADLRDLLASKGYTLDRAALNKLVIAEMQRIKTDDQYNRFKEELDQANCGSREDLLNQFVLIYGKQYEANEIAFLCRLLREMDIQFDQTEIEKEVAELAKLESLKQFERKLRTGKRKSIEDTDYMDGVEFEQLVAWVYRKLGYQVQLTSRSHDQGADLIVSRSSKVTVIQAKRYAGKVSNTAIQEAVAAIKHYSADEAIVVTNSYFTASAVDLAKSNRVELIDRDELAKLIERAN